MTGIDKLRITGSFVDQLDHTLKSKIDTIYKKVNDDSEFEMMFFNYKQDQNQMSLEHFLKLLQYLTHKSKAGKLDLVKTLSLDISYTHKKGENYRISINGKDSIKKYTEMFHNRKNHVVFSMLAGLSAGDKDIILIKKVKDRENIIDIDDFNIRARLSAELKVSNKEVEELKQLDETVRTDINYRYKERVSLKLDKNISIDLTDIKTATSILGLTHTYSTYELEIDQSGKSPKSNLDLIFNEVNILLKIIQQSNYVISKSTEQQVVDRYASLLSLKKDDMIGLAGRKAQSLEVQHVVDNLPNRYAVTDKADGDRCFLIIYQNAVFFITDALSVRSTGIILPNDKYNDTILDGELVFIGSKNRHLFLAFDCLYKSGKDIRQIASFWNRLQELDDVINSCFVSKGHKYQKLTDYDGKFDDDAILKYHSDQITKYMDALNQDIAMEKGIPLVRRKYFINVFGGKENEIFKYSLLMWNKYTKDGNIKCPYILDGLIYPPLDQKYATSAKEVKHIEYKWKPAEKNSVDFYVEYEKNRDTGAIVTLYDNSREDYGQLRGKPYKVLRLFCGKRMKDGVQPVPFNPEKDPKDAAYIFLRDGEIRDLQGDIIQDSTVVEFYYNNDPSIPDKHRWIPIRTRYDKTETMKRYGTNYGNYLDIAYKIWRSIRNPVSMNDMNILANDATFNKHRDIMRGKIDHSVIVSERKENQFNQLRAMFGKSMKHFYDWLLSSILYTNLNPIYEKDDRQVSVLDIGCGRGMEIMKFYYTRVAFYVGIDVDNNTIISPSDGAFSRYTIARKKKPNFPNMFFIHADGSAPLNYEDQKVALGGMSENNQKLMNKFFPNTQFDRITCFKTITNFLENELTWNNFTANLNQTLKPNGYFVVVTFDADKILTLFETVNQHTAYFTDNAGQQRILFELVKKYEGVSRTDIIGPGAAIDYHNALEDQEGSYNTEYLVQTQFLQKSLLEKCQLELVETDLFENQMAMHLDFFEEAAKYESTEETNNFLKSITEFYKDRSEINKASREFNSLYRYYIFRKINPTETNLTKPVKEKPAQKGKGKGKKKSKKTQKGGVRADPFNEIPSLIDPTKFVKKDLLDGGEYSFLAALHDIIKTNKIIPEKTTLAEFYDDIGYKLVKDTSIDKKVIADLISHLTIKHETAEDGLETALNGLNVVVLAADCDTDCKVTKSRILKKNPIVLLYNDGAKYYPIYRAKDDEYNGMFSHDKPFLKKILAHK